MIDSNSSFLDQKKNLDKNFQPFCIKRSAVSRMPTQYGEFTAVAYADEMNQVDHLALVMGKDFIYPNDDRNQIVLKDNKSSILVRIHSECLSGDVFSSLRCDCGLQLQQALQQIAQIGQGVFIYLCGHEGRGVGLTNKIRAYALQDQGHNTVAANTALKLPIDARSYVVAAAILHDLHIKKIRLMTNNPKKIMAVKLAHIEITERVPLLIEPQAENRQYLETKQKLLGHLLDLNNSK